MNPEHIAIGRVPLAHIDFVNRTVKVESSFQGYLPVGTLALGFQSRQVRVATLIDGGNAFPDQTKRGKSP